ncbi:MAG: biotin synthase [Campylobacteraceae bacterium]|nr:biotin synthase [Campylobacteraceae bacterium]MBT3883059.1 biotin synthase [Campylobacteraceae bacterium]MBT4030719.1 biotin synthase [Campylobacteraceae bacterium]MBT4178592.1 biotin synthase [Campylobacteraceae bacterium]MBT4572690.1 biotin synthase [Campylobacteraceae bacterium]
MINNKKIFLCAICNIESGTCKEDCKFCTQSVKYKADIERYKRKSIEDIVQEAKQARENKAIGYCLVTAGKGLNDSRLEFVCEAAHAVKKLDLGLKIIACNGTATTDQLKELKKAGVDNYNHNLETSKAFYKTICTTHDWDERYQTCLNVHEAGLKLVCGGIFGLGESEKDRLSMINSIASLNPMNVPINFFHPNEALPLVKNSITKEKAFELIHIVRQMVPNAHKIMVAGGREITFNEDQYKVFDYGANSIVVGNYLTTEGKVASKDIEELEKRGYEIASSCYK